MSENPYLYDWYSELPYQYPVVETYPVVRVPVAGPEPYNTLAIVRGAFPVVPGVKIADGHIHRTQMSGATTFELVGHDPRVEPVFDHSTTISLQMIQQDDDAAFTWAVDTVDASFDDRGRWTITVDTAWSLDNELGTARAYFSSWILCHEPPVDFRKTPGMPRQQGLHRTNFELNPSLSALSQGMSTHALGIPRDGRKLQQASELPASSEMPSDAQTC